MKTSCHSPTCLAATASASIARARCNLGCPPHRTTADAASADVALRHSQGFASILHQIPSQPLMASVNLCEHDLTFLIVRGGERRAMSCWFCSLVDADGRRTRPNRLRLTEGVQTSRLTFTKCNHPSLAPVERSVAETNDVVSPPQSRWRRGRP